MSTMPNISDLVDISETHGDMIPREKIDYYIVQNAIGVRLTEDYHNKLTIHEYLMRGTQHYCRPEDVPQKETYPKYYECTEKETFAFRKRINEDWYTVVKYSGEETVNFPWSTRFPIKDIMITEEAAMSRIKTVKEIKLEVGKTYLTEGNYIVHIACANPSTGRYFATIECSPGLDGAGLSINEFLKSSNCKRCYSFKKYGWAYESNGVIHLGTPNKWTKKLKIVEECPFELPKLSSEYKWAGGYPQFRKPNVGEYYFSYTWVSQNKHIHQCDSVNETMGGQMGDRRLILEKISVEKQHHQVSAKESTPPRERPFYYQGDKSNLVDITDSHKDMVPRVNIDYYTNYGTSLQLTSEVCDNAKTIGEWYKSNQMRHFCLKEDLTPVAKPEESDDDWVTQDKVPNRPGIDEVSFIFNGGYAGAYVKSSADFDSRLHGSVDKRGDKLLIRCRRSDYPVEAKMEIKPNNYYLTEGGYIVALDERFKSLWEMPGSILGGLNTWKWEKDGSIEGIDPVWATALKIKEILQVEFPKELPTGYQWKDGVPQFRQPKNGEEYWDGGKINYVGTAFRDHSSTSVSWFILEKIKNTAAKPNTPILTEEYEFTSDPPEYRTPKSGEWYFSQKYCLPVKAESKYIDVPESHRFIVRQKKKVATPLVEKALITPEQDTALIRNETFSPPEKPLSLLSYWVTEPAHNTYTAAKKSVRYVVLWGVLSGIGYTAYNPAGVARFVKSCLPKITVRYEDVERSKI